MLLINTYDTGGAAKACFRLHEGLLKQGISSKLLILFSKKDYPHESNIAVYGREFPYHYKKPNILKRIAIRAGMGKHTEKIRREIENIPKNQSEIFSEPYSNYDFTQHPWYKEADLINLHWVSGFLDYSFFDKNTKPVIWTLHDMNAFTGGCHYSKGCDKFTDSCDYCHYLKTTSNPEYTKTLLNYKKKYLSEYNLQIVSPSEWLRKKSSESMLFNQFNHTLIPYGIDTTVFKPYSKGESRKELGLPANKKILLFVAERVENPRKGSAFIFDLVNKLQANKDIILCAVGKPPMASFENLISLGEIKSEVLLAKIYSAADVLLVPSLEDNLPNTPVESILCGTPVIAFRIGGLTDIITNGENGYLCDGISSDELLNKVNFFLNNGVANTPNKISQSAVLKYNISISVKRYNDLYTEVLNGN